LPGLVALFLIGAFLVFCVIANLQALTQKQTTDSGSPCSTPFGLVQQAWVARYNGPGSSNDISTAIAIDGSGNTYVTGYSFDQTTGYNYATIKYNSAGQQQWVARYVGPANSTGFAYAIAVDASGNIYVTGESLLGPSRDYATVKYNSSGQQQWVARYNGPGNSDDFAKAIAVDDEGNVYVTGGSAGSGSGSDFATIKYNSAGQERWVARYDGPANDGDLATAIAVDNSGNVYVTGWSIGSKTFSDYATVKYNSTGQEQWVAHYNGPANYIDEPAAIAVDNLGNVYVTGYSGGLDTYND
jgi:hypothetical protein